MSIDSDFIVNKLDSITFSDSNLLDEEITSNKIGKYIYFTEIENNLFIGYVVGLLNDSTNESFNNIYFFTYDSITSELCLFLSSTHPLKFASSHFIKNARECLYFSFKRELAAIAIFDPNYSDIVKCLIYETNNQSVIEYSTEFNFNVNFTPYSGFKDFFYYFRQFQSNFKTYQTDSKTVILNSPLINKISGKH